MKFRQRLLLFGVAVAALTAAAIFLAGGTLIRRSVGDRVRERLDSEVLFLSETLAGDPRLLPAPAVEPPAAGHRAAAGPGLLPEPRRVGTDPGQGSEATAPRDGPTQGSSNGPLSTTAPRAERTPSRTSRAAPSACA